MILIYITKKKYFQFLLLIFGLFYFSNQLSAQIQQNQSSSIQSRIQTYKNELDLLAIEIPGLNEKLNVNISNTNLSNFMRAVGQVHNVNIDTSSELNDIIVANGFNNLTVQNLLLFLIEKHGLELKTIGNIISLTKYTPPISTPVEKEIVASYNPLDNTLSLDLDNDPLPKVTRKLSEISGNNILFSPALSSTKLTLFLQEVDFDTAIEKLAQTHNIEYYKTKDGFFELLSTETEQNSPSQSRRRQRRNQENYRVLDTLNKIITVNLKDVPVSQILNGLIDDLDLNVFLASPLEEAGTVTMKADKISFDLFLQKIFQQKKSDTPTISNSNPSENRNFNNTQNQNVNNNQNTSDAYTYKKEGDIYYFGSENLLSTRSIEIVQMMHRSIAMLGDPDPANNFGVNNNFNSGNFVSGGTNFYGGQNGFNTNSGNIQNRNQNRTSSFSQNTTSTNTSSGELGSVLNVLPNSITEGLDIKIDTELNSFVISGPGTRVENFKKYIKYIDKPVPLILLEVMILEVNKVATLDTGVEFGLRDEPTTTEGVSFPDANITLGAQTVNRIIGGFDGFGSLNIGNVLPNFYLDIKALETNGNVKILSTPKLSTLNGHKAFLSSGQTTYYEVVSQNIFGSQNPQTSEIVNYQPIDAELALEFKPFVAGDGQITLNIQVIQSNFSGERIAEGAPPDINSRKFSSILRMRDNDIAILGGIEQKIKNDSGSGVPFLARIPIIKWFFSKRIREDSKRKLNVIIKPTIFY